MKNNLNEIRLKMLTQIFRLIELYPEVDNKTKNKLSRIVGNLNKARSELRKLEVKLKWQ